MGVRYRVRQFTIALGANINRETTKALREYLAASQLELFRSMSSIDQHHGWAVFRTLREAQEAEASLLRAALLHDVGKTIGPVRIWHRVIAVLARALAPRFWEMIDGNSGTWRYPFYVHRHHAALGAELAREAGCSPEAVWLIAHHEDHRGETDSADGKNGLLVALQAADELN
ncbi:MAG: hypothetical protein CEE40_10895 [Chloroflexi bacterium B3_Chlor]|nr:MAG: hypothetical protein CEE40_10895 [Chloroflexi bacterium B3_Chlor]